jgi:hypothetical protein
VTRSRREPEPKGDKRCSSLVSFHLVILSIAVVDFLSLYSVLKTTANNKQTVLHTFESVMKESEDDESEWLMKKFKATSE